VGLHAPGAASRRAAGWGGGGRDPALPGLNPPSPACSDPRACPGTQGGGGIPAAPGLGAGLPLPPAPPLQPCPGAGAARRESLSETDAAVPVMTAEL